jgi:hypothetical protein
MSLETFESVVATPAATEASNSTESFSSVGITTEKKTYRTYGTIDANGLPVEPKVKRETADGKTWAALEASGKSVLAENVAITYILEDESAFPDLVPDPEQRRYIIQKGIEYIQNTSVKVLGDFNDTTGEFNYNGQEVDLRPFLNEPPSRTRKTELQKVTALLPNLNPADAAALFAQLQTMMAAAQNA